MAYLQSLAHKEIDGETADAMAAKVKEAIAIGHAAGYDGGSVTDLIHGITYLSAWNRSVDDDPGFGKEESGDG